jgi:preprotein translocase subunit SecG
MAGNFSLPLPAENMTILITLIHVIVCLLLILIVLLQSGKAADLAGAFGGTGSQTAFGARGTATFLSKLTTAAAIIFMLTSMVLNMVKHKGSSGSIMEGAKTPVQSQTAPPKPLVTMPQAPAAPQRQQK